MTNHWWPRFNNVADATKTQKSSATIIIMLLHILKALYTEFADFTVELKVIVFNKITGAAAELFQIVSVVSKDVIQTLIECFNDTFEQNKLEAFKFLSAVPEQYRFYNVS